MKILENQLRPGMILYSVPCTFDDLDSERYRVFCVFHDGEKLLVPAETSGSFEYRLFNVTRMVGLDFYTTWETALIAAKQRLRVASEELTIRENKVQVLIERERNESH